MLHVIYNLQLVTEVKKKKQTFFYICRKNYFLRNFTFLKISEKILQISQKAVFELISENI